MIDSSITGDSVINIKPKKIEVNEVEDEETPTPKEPVEFGYTWKPVKIMTDQEVQAYVKQQNSKLTNTEKLV